MTTRAAVLAMVLACSSPATAPPKDLTTPPTERDGIGTPLGEACVTLRRIGCGDGLPNRKGRTCFEFLSSAAELAPVPAECLRSATSLAVARACGSVNDVRVRCRE